MIAVVSKLLLCFGKEHCPFSAVTKLPFLPVAHLGILCTKTVLFVT